MLPHLVADHDQVVLARDRCNRLQLVALEQPTGRIVRIVEQDGAGFAARPRLQRLLFDAPVGRPERHLAHDPPARRTIGA